MEMFHFRAVVVAKLTEQLLPASEVHSLNPFNGKYFVYCQLY